MNRYKEAILNVRNYQIDYHNGLRDEDVEALQELVNIEMGCHAENYDIDIAMDLLGESYILDKNEKKVCDWNDDIDYAIDQLHKLKFAIARKNRRIKELEDYKGAKNELH